QIEKLFVEAQSLSLGLQRFAKYVVNLVFVGFEEMADFERGVLAEMSDDFAGRMRVSEAQGGLIAQPRDDWNAAVTKYHKGVVSVTHDSGKFCFKYLIQDTDDLGSVKILFRHG